MNAPLPVVVVLLSSLVSFASRAAPAGETSRGDDAAALRGTWTCASAVIDGKPLAEKVVKQLRLTIDRERYKTERAGEVLFDSTYRLDPSKEPREIEMTATEGDAAGQPALGIYSVDGDTLRMCYVMPGGARPKAFESAPGSKTFLVTWKRAAAEPEKRRDEEAPAESKRALHELGSRGRAARSWHGFSTRADDAGMERCPLPKVARTG